jgi:hypothetical protein
LHNAEKIEKVILSTPSAADGFSRGVAIGVTPLQRAFCA